MLSRVARLHSSECRRACCCAAAGSAVRPLAPREAGGFNVLVKSGKEWHSPDRMILNERAILFVEPVGSASKVSQLIAESKH